MAPLAQRDAQDSIIEKTNTSALTREDWIIPFDFQINLYRRTVFQQLIYNIRGLAKGLTWCQSQTSIHHECTRSHRARGNLTYFRQGFQAKPKPFMSVWLFAVLPFGPLLCALQVLQIRCPLKLILVKEITTARGSCLTSCITSALMSASDELVHTNHSFVTATEGRCLIETNTSGLSLF